MYFPQPDNQPKQSLKPGRTGPDLAVLLGLWLFAATLGLFVGYLPPRFKPQWLYKLMLVSIFLVWIGVGIVLLIFGADGLVGVIQGSFAIAVGIGGLGYFLLYAEVGTSHHATSDGEQTK